MYIFFICDQKVMQSESYLLCVSISYKRGLEMLTILFFVSTISFLSPHYAHLFRCTHKIATGSVTII